MSCAMWTPHNNKFLWGKARRRRHQYEGGETLQEVTADLGAVAKDLKKTTGALKDDTCSGINVMGNIHT